VTVYKVDRDGESSQWSVGDKPRGLAVTADGNLLVTCSVRNQLRLFTDDGLLVRDLALPDDITCPWHAVQTYNRDHFLVFHGSSTDAGYQLSVRTRTRNSPGDEIANVNFLYNDIVHVVQNTMDSCIHSATNRRGGYVLERMFTKFSEITQCNGHYAVQGHSRSPILVPVKSSYTTSC